MASIPPTVAQLMSRFRQGDPRAAGQLVELFYPELRRLAVARMKAERPEHTWRPTALVNELYLTLVKVKALRAGDPDSDSEKEAFLSLAAHIMRQLLISHARPLAKRAEKVELSDAPDSHTPGADALLELDNVLNRLAALDPRLRTVVELRVFEGLTREEIAERMGCGPATVARHWTFAKGWLEKELAADQG